MDNKKEQVFWINQWEDDDNHKHYEIICNISFDTDEGIKTMVEVMEALKTSVQKMADVLQKEMENRGIVPVTNPNTGQKIMKEITQKLEAMSPSEAHQFIKDMHGILVKGK